MSNPILSKKTIGFILIGLLVFIALLIIYFSNVTLKSPFSKSINKLRRHTEFYEAKRNQTLKYLDAVYPKNSFHNLSDLELAAFYNSLWVYYNCEASYDNGGDLCWKAVEGCGTIYPKLPYTPQGWIYSFRDWVNNWTPFIDSDSTRHPKEIIASVPGMTFGNGSFYFNGPSPVWMYQRAIFRMIYNPVTQKVLGNRLLSDISNNGNTAENRMRTIGEPIPGSLDSMKPEWKYPKHWWKGIPDYGYMEVMAASEPGLPFSPPILWYDGWIGSGQFLYMGKSHRARNKGHCCLTLAKEITQTIEGKKKLIEWFGSPNPYEIVKRVGFYGSVDTKPSWSVCNFDPLNTANANSRGALVSTSDGTAKSKCNFCNNAWGSGSSLPDTPWGWNDTRRDYIFQWNSWCLQNNPDGTMSDQCIEDFVSGANYRSDRNNNNISWDEVNFLMGLYAGYDTIQMTNSANGNGFWQYEIMELRGYPAAAKDRDYSAFITLNKDANNDGVTCNPTTLSVSYNPTFVNNYLATIPSKTLSVRDPLDVFNENMVSKCSTPPYPPKNPINFGPDYNLTCDENYSRMFKNLSVVNCTPTCGSQTCNA